MFESGKERERDKRLILKQEIRLPFTHFQNYIVVGRLKDSIEIFLDTQVSLAPTHVSPSVGR